MESKGDRTLRLLAEDGNMEECMEGIVSEMGPDQWSGCGEGTQTGSRTFHAEAGA